MTELFARMGIGGIIEANATRKALAIFAVFQGERTRLFKLNRLELLNRNLPIVSELWYS